MADLMCDVARLVLARIPSGLEGATPHVNKPPERVRLRVLRRLLLRATALVALALLKVLVRAFGPVALVAPERVTFLAAIDGAVAGVAVPVPSAIHGHLPFQG